MEKFKINFVVAKTRTWPWDKWHTQSVAFADEESVNNLLEILRIIVKENKGTLEVKKPKEALSHFKEGEDE